MIPEKNRRTPPTYPDVSPATRALVAELTKRRTDHAILAGISIAIASGLLLAHPLAPLAVTPIAFWQTYLFKLRSNEITNVLKHPQLFTPKDESN